MGKYRYIFQGPLFTVWTIPLPSSCSEYLLVYPKRTVLYSKPFQKQHFWHVAAATFIQSFTFTC